MRKIHQVKKSAEELVRKSRKRYQRLGVLAEHGKKYRTLNKSMGQFHGGWTKYDFSEKT